MSEHGRKPDEAQGASILPILRRLRRRWRLRVVLRGLTATGATALVAFLASAWGLDAARFSPGAVTAARWLAWGAVALVAALTLVRPLLRRLSDEQVALYLEEHEPSLQAAILGAVEAEKRAATGGAGVGAAPGRLALTLVRRASERARAVEFGDRIEQPGLYRYSGGLVGVALFGVGALLLAPEGLRHGVGAILSPAADAAAVSPYAVLVEPGDTTIARGSDQTVRARLRGFATDQVHLYTSAPGSEDARRLSLLPSDEGWELLLLDLRESTEYWVEADGVRSPTYTIEVADLPYVERMDHTYRFPDYTGLEPRVVEDGGDVAVPAGTEVEMRIEPTLAVPGGRVVIDGERTVELEPAGDGGWTARFEVTGPGWYRVLLDRPGAGEAVEASPRYTIDVLRDLPPSVSVTRPGRDTPVSPIEEVFVEARADDDFGVTDVRLIWSVNGGPEDTAAIFGAAGAPLGEVTASHTLFLEDYPLETGDLVSYYVQARDAGPAAEWVTSDLYFLQVRPFRRDFRQAEQQPPGGGEAQGGGQGPETALSELQRQIVVGTFNVLRDRETTEPETWRESLTSLALAQGRVREQVATLVTRMNNRGIAQADEQFREIAALLPEALEDMERAEERLREAEPDSALPLEQAALRVLQKAEETYERYVGEQQQGGGGGGGGGANAEDLADLFELELDQMRNQYETVQRGERRQANTEVDELMEKLEELARRQEQEMERQRARGAAQQGSAAGGADAQRALAEESEEAARQLERLARETGDRELQETSRRLQEAADAMRRSAARQNAQAGAAEAGAALDELREAERRLRRNRETRLSEDAQDARERVERLAAEQREVMEEIEGMPEDPTERAERLRRLVDRKSRMLSEAVALENQLERMAAGARGENAEAAERLREAAEAIRDTKLKERIAHSRGVVTTQDSAFVRSMEEDIAENLERVRRETEEAVQAAGRVAEDRTARENLERAQDLNRAVQSLGRRLDPDAQRPGQEGEQPGEQQGQQGQQGQQQGQQGDRGQPGPQGQQGQQGDGRPGAVGDARGEPSGNPAEGGGGGATRGTPRPFTPEEIRQYQRAFAEQLEAAGELRRELVEAGRDVTDLDRAIEAMRDLSEAQTYGDLPQVPLLQQTLQESLKRVEFTLRRDLGQEEAGPIGLGASGNVPEGFRELVEEYYRSLARERSGGR